MTLRAIVIGTGWAGEGHTTALRAAGVEVVAICGRTPEPTQAMAAKLGIGDVRFDWRQALEALRPDILSIATTAAPHREMAEFAAQLGCHILCDKPLGVNAQEARAMLAAVERAGVKHAYGSTSRYAPTYLFARQLLAEGLIGSLREIESMLHVNFSPLLPYSWFHQLELGGGMLNTLFTHTLGQVLFITGGKVTAVTGEARRLLKQAPVGATIHDMRTIFHQLVQVDETTEWRTVDADMAYTVLAQLEMADGKLASALFKGSAFSVGRHPNALALYGELGTLHLSDDRLEHFDLGTAKWQELPVPTQITASLPQVDNNVQRDWNQLFREFVADIRGEGNSGYPTFHEGWLHNVIIDIVRRNHGYQLWSKLGN